MYSAAQTPLHLSRGSLKGHYMGTKPLPSLFIENMSVSFSSIRPRGKGEVTQQTIQKMLDENHHLIQCIMDYQSKGKTVECTQYQQILHRNLVYLATIADTNQNMQSLLPAPPNPTINIGSSGMSQGSGSQTLHSHANMNDSMGTGLPPTSLMQSQMSNVSMMHQQGSAPHYSSTSAGGQHYQGQQTAGIMGQGNQGSNMMPQRPMGSYRAAQQGSAQYMGQEEFYGEQYGHAQSSSEPSSISQQYYSDAQGDHSYRQSAYGEGYERSFDESTQHYYEGGNSQYSQQQTQYQHGTGQHQPFSQQQYSSQAGYSAQLQGYGPGQGSSSQYPQYQHSQGQQYSSYRSAQPGSNAQSQRSYSFEQGQYGNYQQ